MLCGTGGYLGSEKAYGAVSGVYPGSNYPCYYTNMDYLPAMGHTPINVPVSIKYKVYLSGFFL